MSTSNSPQGNGARRAVSSGRGRPRLSDEVRRVETVHARLTKAEAEKFLRLGGSRWLRRVLQQTKDTP